VHRDGTDNDGRVVGDFLLLLGGAGRGLGSDEQTVEERRPEQGLVQCTEECSQRGYVLDPPTVKRLEYVSKKNESILTGALLG
jgi:hypothetical protein